MRARAYPTASTEVVTFEIPLSESPIFRRVGSVIPLHVARRYTGDDFNMPLERMMDATEQVLRNDARLERVSKVAPHPRMPAPVRVLLWTHPLLVDASAPTVTPILHTTVRDDYGPGLAVDARFAPASTGGAARTLRLAVSSHPRPTAVVVTGWNVPAATTTVAMLSDDDSCVSCEPFVDGAVAVAAADASVPRGLVHAVTTVDALGTSTAYAVDEAHRRLIVWLDSATIARGVVLEFTTA